MSWAKFNSVLAKALSYLPYILQGVVAVESVQVPGATKKQLVLGSIQAAAGVASQIEDREIAAISATIDTVVGVFNKSGWPEGSKPASDTTAPATAPEAPPTPAEPPTTS